MINIMCKYEGGRRCAIVAKPYELVGLYLESDIQDCVEECDELLDICKKVEKGDLVSWGGCGNANEITIEPGKVTIELMFICEKVVVSLSDYRIAVETWRSFISF